MKNSQEIDDMLRASAEEPPLPTNFRSEVWTRIALAEQRSLAVLARRALAALTRPAPSVACLVATALVGVATGLATAPPVKDAQLSYAESVSPFLQERTP